jgi:hypothetical protein
VATTSAVGAVGPAGSTKRQHCRFFSRDGFGAAISLPNQLQSPEERPVGEFVQRLKETIPPPTRVRAPPLPIVPPHLVVAHYVYICRGGKPSPLLPLYQGPFEVVEAGPKHFVLRVGAQLETVSVDRLKPHLGQDPVAPAEPARRGRPKFTGSLIISGTVQPPSVTSGALTGGGGPVTTLRNVWSGVKIRENCIVNS